MTSDLFQSCGYCWVFQICWHIECSTFTASSFRIWNSSAGILSPPLALSVMMLPRAHLTSHTRMSGLRWVNTPSWLSGSCSPFPYSSSVYSYHLFLISSASVRAIPFPSFIVPILAWNVPLILSIFLKRSPVFCILLFSPISLYCSFKKASFFSSLLFSRTLHSVGYIFPFLPCLLLFFPQLYAKHPQTTTLPSCISFWIHFLYCCCCCQVASVVSDSVQPHRQQPTRLLRPWDSPGKNTGVGCPFLLHIFYITDIKIEPLHVCRDLKKWQ